MDGFYVVVFPDVELVQYYTDLEYVQDLLGEEPVKPEESYPFVIQFLPDRTIKQLSVVLVADPNPDYYWSIGGAIQDV